MERDVDGPHNVERQPLLPHPLPIKTVADFVVVVFAMLVVAVLLSLTIGVVVAALEGEDVRSYFTVITDIMTTIIGALVGYLAGRGSSHTETAHHD